MAITTAMLRHGPTGPRPVTPNLFGIPFGLAGLGSTWLASESSAGPAVASVLFVCSGASLLVMAVAWVRSARAGDASWTDTARTTLADRRFGPFLSLAPITAALLASHLPWAEAARTGVIVATALCWVLAALLMASWMNRRVSVDEVHPGYFLPTVAAGFVTADALVRVGLIDLAMVMFGAGMLFWFLFGPIILARLMTQPPLPLPLRPTLAINAAPAVVGANAWHAITPTPDALAYAFAGAAMALLLVELANISRYRQVPFGPGYWSFTFVAAAAATWSMRWTRLVLPPGWADAVTTVTLGAVTAFIAAIAALTVLHLVQGRFLPPLTSGY